MGAGSITTIIFCLIFAIIGQPTMKAIEIVSNKSSWSEINKLNGYLNRVAVLGLDKDLKGIKFHDFDPSSWQRVQLLKGHINGHEYNLLYDFEVDHEDPNISIQLNQYKCYKAKAKVGQIHLCAPTKYIEDKNLFYQHNNMKFYLETVFRDYMRYLF